MNRDILEMKTFQDLVFKKHPLLESAEKIGGYQLEFWKGSKQARMQFNNGYELSVICGEKFYSNGIDTYECMVVKDGKQVGDILGNLTSDQVSALMTKVQMINKINKGK